MKTTIFALSLCYIVSLSSALLGSDKIGINYGRIGNNLPSPYRSIELLQSMNVRHVKLYDSDPEVLKLLSGTNIHVTVMVPNDQITRIASNRSEADEWVHKNVLAYYPSTKIRFVLVGNEVFSHNDQQVWVDLVPAMRYIRKSLNEHNIHNIKVGTPVAMDVLESSFPPSAGKFRADVAEVMTSVVKFLNGTRSFFFLDVYPFFPWSASPTSMSLDFALLKEGNRTYIDPHTGLIYTNLLDQMLDSVNFAMEKLGFHDVRIVIAETGWPHEGDIDQPGANDYNSATYLCNLAAKMSYEPPLGTPARPGVEIPTFIFSLYDENQKPGPGTERHWGLLNSRGLSIHQMDLSGACPAGDKGGARHLAKPVNNQPYKGKIWCVSATTMTREMELAPAVEFACLQGNNTCKELAPGGACYEPVSIVSHASYAFSSYWAKFRGDGASCYFNGLAVQTTVDPSHGSCKFPSVTV
ncbi:probable glucan endo-1,3-beta-glucosidase A6 [Salvia miltiorrhiza]|uniref:probable glucan endo-1,3-beta-glucosidase A6 n=1 Tax=Salvia miltiorrhiza TaxID=226208 RepID=UPI0025ACAFBB|nr:probable glucan endo-1,3-beta-glucosidase A6 [Salvia miltiorrhiza]